MPQNTGAELVLLAMYLCVAALVVIGLIRTFAPSRRRLPALGTAEWSALQGGVPADLHDDPAFTAYARRSRGWRVIGIMTALVGYTVWNLVAAGRQLPIIGPLEALLVGWLLAGIVPELFARNRPAAEVRVAALRDRAPARFVTVTARRWLVGSLALTMAAAGLAIASGRTWSWGGDGLVVGASIALAATATVALARIARRPQPAGRASDVTIDDAIRGLATTRVISAWTALQFLAATRLVPTTSTPSEAWFFWPAQLITYGALVGVLAAWAWVPTRLPRAQPPHVVVSA